MADSTQLEQQAVERLSEDESLRGRGEITDFGFEPILKWGIAVVTAYAQQAADEAQMDAYTDRVREVMRAAVAAAEAGKMDDPAALTDFEPSDKAALQTKLAALTLSDDPDANGEQIAAVLQQAGSPKKEETATRQPAAFSKEPEAKTETTPTTPEQQAEQPEKNKTTSEVRTEVAAPETKTEATAPQAKTEAATPEIKTEVATPQAKTEATTPETKTEVAAPQAKTEVTTSEKKSVATAPEKKSVATVPENGSVPPESKNAAKSEASAHVPGDLECRLGAASLRRNYNLHNDLGGTETNFENPPQKEAKKAPDADAETNNATTTATALGNVVAEQLNLAFAGIRNLLSSNDNRKDTGENQDEQETAHHHQPQPEK